MKLRIALFILSVAAMAAFGLFTQARAETTQGIFIEGNGHVSIIQDPPCEETKKHEPPAEDDGSYFTHKHWHREP